LAAAARAARAAAFAASAPACFAAFSASLAAMDASLAAFLAASSAFDTQPLNRVGGGLFRSGLPRFQPASRGGHQQKPPPRIVITLRHCHSRRHFRSSPFEQVIRRNP
jgi:hypothetical protein